ncbi:MAG TPA: glycosyltransferase family 2 protein [Stellaceae bacterium]|nr:glycosyltransferase family 2 protein [Stellaceae bacterium]
MIEASIVICAYTLDRWDDINAAVGSVRNQTTPPREILLVIDGNEALRARAAAEIAGVTVAANAGTPGLSGARMTGAALASAPVIAFLDDDAIADPDWLAELLAPYQDENVLGVGGYIEPLWVAPPPGWFPAEFNWVVGCTYKGMPVRQGRVRNAIGANMSVRADVLRRAGGFATKLGRREGRLLAKGIAESCEETEFCIRTTRLHPGGYWIYSPTARVRHKVPAARTSWAYFVRRCRMEGTAKAVLTGLAGSGDGLESERRYTMGLVRAVFRELAAALAGDPSAAGRAGAIGSGLAITAIAYLRTRIGRALMRAERPLPAPEGAGR